MTIGVLSAATIAVAQEPPPVPLDDPSVETEPGSAQPTDDDPALQPIPEGETADDESSDCNCQDGGVCNAAGNCGRCGGTIKSAIAALNDPARKAEKQHQKYLKSVKPGHKMYTHQWNQYHAQQLPWHGYYYHRDYGKPLALVVPPTAEYQTHWGWGVGSTTTTPIYHQYSRPYPSAYAQEQVEGMPRWRFRRTPNWPSHTSQYGAYYIRAPW